MRVVPPRDDCAVGLGGDAVIFARANGDDAIQTRWNGGLPDKITDGIFVLTPGNERAVGA